MSDQHTVQHALPTALSVNVNKVALLRNSRHLAIPSVTRAAQLCLEAGANGITVHPRPDARHIRPNDVDALAELMRDWPQAEFNIEGNPFHNLLELAERYRPHQCTLVPDGQDQFTSDHGWNLPQDSERLLPVVRQLHDWGIRVSLFMDPSAESMEHAKAVGADRVELYTETYAVAHAQGRDPQVLTCFGDAALAALEVGLGVNAGHDLNCDNLPLFLQTVPGVLEVSIGHAFIADALELGYAQATQAYLRAIALGHGVRL
jgi:pyridoxine 5-phosphate synthase